MEINNLLTFLIVYIPLVTLCFYKDFKANLSHPMDYFFSFLISSGASLIFLLIINTLVDSFGKEIFKVFMNISIIVIISVICFFISKFLSKKIFTNVDK